MATNFPTSVDNFTNPTANDSLNAPSHSVQHANANDAIEAIETVLVPAVNAWTTFTPTFNNLTIGNGVLNAAYSVLGKTVYVRIGFTWGSTTSATAGQTQIVLPITAKNLGTGYPVTMATMEDVGTNLHFTQAIVYTPSNFLYFQALNTASSTLLSGASVANTVPFTWTTNDNFQIYFSYEAA